MRRVVLDTNVVLSSLPKSSPYRKIFDSLLSNHYRLIVSNEIISEYVEIIAQKATPEIAQNVGELILNLKNVEKVEVFYRWDLIEIDPDDNKFVDCAVAGNASFIVTSDHHFNILKSIPFPKVEIMTIEQFVEELTVGR